ncbi:MAG TPA: ParB/RepB/Spo0J family partition protein [Bryobacteraceae bacterium]|nr:ParB/RepB/Spo0J family partition protein [Bryobacteraceae bacterium]
MKHVRQNHIASPYRDLPLMQLQESPTNPRRRYDETAMQELAVSIQSQGILAPLLVRRLEPSQFEVIAGSRRFRAAKIAELSDVPVRIVEMTDAQVLEAQCVENLQREDVHPLEEANAFSALLREHFDVATIAAKIGKPATFVVSRIQLTQLIAPIADAFLADKLTIGHATLIAKLPQAHQPEAFTASYRNVWMTEGQTQILVPVKELASWIESNILMELRTASFDRKDAELVPDAGSCHDCPKRTGANALLFPESQRDACLDRECFQAKINAHVARSIERNANLIQITTTWNGHRNGGPLSRNHYTEIVAAKSGRKAKTERSPAQTKCPHVAEGLVVEGADRGRTLTICAEPTCPVHHAEAQKAREAQQETRASQRKEDQRRKEGLLARQRILSAILQKVSEPTKADLELVAREFFGNLSHEYRAVVAEEMRPVGKGKQPSHHDVASAFEAKLRGTDQAGLNRLLLGMALLDATFNTFSGEGAKQLEAVAKRYRVNTKTLRQAVHTELAEKLKKQGQRKKESGAGTGRNRKTKSKRATA